MGVDETEAICSLLSGLVDHPVANLGIPGASPEMVRDVYLHLRASGTPRGVVILWPFFHRRMVVLPDRILRLGMWTFDHPEYQSWQYPDIVNAFRDDIGSGVLERDNRRLIQEFETEHALTDNFYIGTFKQLMQEGNRKGLPVIMPQGFLDFSDDEHPGPVSHAAAAQALAQIINTKWNLR